MSAHTPGPWDVKQPAKRSWIPAFAMVVCARSRLVDDRTVLEAPVADIHTLSFSDTQEAQANARLIAAAPDLLVALTELMTLYLQFENANFDTAKATFDNARAAIAKAEGQ